MDSHQQHALRRFGQACQRLQELVSVPDNRIVRDALIKRFEFSFEAGRNAAYCWIRARGIAVSERSDAVILQALKLQLVTDELGWGEICRYRDRADHADDDAVADEVAAFARGPGQALLAELLQALQAHSDD